MRKGHNNRCKFAWNVMTICFSVFLMVSTVNIYTNIEPIVNPIIKDFIVDDVAYTENTLTLTGTMNKVRSCEFMSMNIYSFEENDRNGTLLNHETTLHRGVSRSVANQTWGPWLISIPRDFTGTSLVIYATHKCNPFWNTYSKLAEFKI